MDPKDYDKEEANVNKPFSSYNRNNPYKFSQDEIRVIKECNAESFFQRCIPLGTILGVSTYFGVKNGYLKASPRFGAAPKVIVSVIVGYFVGKFSYQSKCAEKLMKLPNSQIGEMLRQRRRGNLRESLDSGFGPGMSLAPFSGMKDGETYSDLGPSSSLDLDTNRPLNEGLDDSQRPSVDNPLYEEEMPPVQKHVTSYDELRKQNREEYQQKRTGVLREISKAPVIDQPKKPSVQDKFDQPVRRNIYGDPMD